MASGSEYMRYSAGTSSAESERSCKRWALRVNAYAFLLTTDEYPPFRLSS